MTKPKRRGLWQWLLDTFGDALRKDNPELAGHSNAALTFLVLLFAAAGSRSATQGPTASKSTPDGQTAPGAFEGDDRGSSIAASRTSTRGREQTADTKQGTEAEAAPTPKGWRGALRSMYAAVVGDHPPRPSASSQKPNFDAKFG
jgi:hypothetical protein